jgi:hypothetical protein
VIPEFLNRSLYGLNWMLAGGWAACPTLASDRDVWVFGLQADELESERHSLLDTLRLNVKSPYVMEEQNDIQTGRGYEGVEITIRKVCVIDTRRKDGDTFNDCRDGSLRIQPIHLMVTDAPSPIAVLMNFDVSTHAVAIMPEGQIHLHPMWTPVNEQPRVLLNNSNTPERMTRITARFAFHTEETPF